MKRTFVAMALLLLSLAGCATAQEKPTKPKSDAAAIEVNVRKLWEAFKNKDKATLSSLIDDGFRQFEEGLTTFADKKTEVNAPDEYDLLSYTLSEFNVKPTGPNSAVVTYIAQYEGKSGGEVAKAKSVFGEVWIRVGSQWKALYMQETYVK
ncbi:MAG: nuclear transport factor 2 family protein [Candidatus Sulfotelmatobacter sp.]